MYKVRKQLSELDLKEEPDEITLEELARSYTGLIKFLNYYTKTMSLDGDFNCYVAQVSFEAAGNPAGSDTQRIEHFLGVVPKYRIILRQEGNGVLEDIPSGWNDKIITLRNRGSEVVKATIMIVRE